MSADQNKPSVTIASSKPAGGGCLVGITGGIAAGKSRVAGYLARHGGFPCLDVDDIARQLLEPGQAGWKAMKEHYGERFLCRDRRIDRGGLRRAIFADAALRTEVNGLLHPLIRRSMHDLAAEQFLAGARVVLVEVPLLYEAGWEDDFALVVVVQATTQICRQRLQNRDQVNGQEACAALAAQMSPEEKARRADVVIENSGDWEQARRLLDRLIPRLSCLVGENHENCIRGDKNKGGARKNLDTRVPNK